MSDEIKLRIKCEVDTVTKDAIRDFDLNWDGVSTFTAPRPVLPDDFSIGLIVGPSGSGKTTIAKQLGPIAGAHWEDSKTIASHFESGAVAVNKLTGVGLNSVPVWCKPYSVLSNGEKHRADMARLIKDGAIIDEYTSVVDRTVARAMSVAISRYVKRQQIRRVVFVTCHYDVAEWLLPDWIYDTGEQRLLPRGSLRRPEIKLEIEPCGVEAWSAFRNHHYLSGDINKAARCWLGIWDNSPIAFMSAIALPSPYMDNAWREHRTVVLPDYQGMGIGVRCSDVVAELFLADGKRYFSKTSHPRMGEYRERSTKWRPTSKNKKARPDYGPDRASKEMRYRHKHMNRLCYSHEYIGGK
jgi:GNAT superfamily N-acetyltransferase